MAGPLREGRSGKIVAWQKNPMILQRMEVGLRAWSACRQPSKQLEIVNQWCIENGFPTISERTLRDDRERSLKYATEQLEKPAHERLAEHVLMYKHAIRLINEELETNSHPVARATLLGNLIKAQSEWSRTTGDTVQHIEQKVVEKTDAEKAHILVQVLVQNYGADEAERLISEARRLESNEQAKVIDVHPADSGAVPQSA